MSVIVTHKAAMMKVAFRIGCKSTNTHTSDLHVHPLICDCFLILVHLLLPSPSEGKSAGGKEVRFNTARNEERQKTPQPTPAPPPPLVPWQHMTLGERKRLQWARERGELLSVPVNPDDDTDGGVWGGRDVSLMSSHAWARKMGHLGPLQRCHWRRCFICVS